MTERSSSPLPPTIRTPDVPRPVSLLPRQLASPNAIKILRDALLLTEGRDKVVKLLQYTCRLILLLSSAPSKRLRPFISQMSMTRKVIKLGHGIYPYMVLTKPNLSTFEVIREIVEFINDFWDDVYCVSRIGTLRSARLERLSEDWANRSWMTGVIMDLYLLFQRRRVITAKLKETEEKKHLKVELTVLGADEISRIREKIKNDAYWTDVSIAKLLADFGFCGLSSLVIH